MRHGSLLSGVNLLNYTHEGSHTYKTREVVFYLHTPKSGGEPGELYCLTVCTHGLHGILFRSQMESMHWNQKVLNSLILGFNG